VYEALTERPIARRHFIRRVLGHLLVAVGLLVVSLILGIWGYGHYEGLPWRDGFLNAAMLLGGMGPVEVPQTPGGKLFAGIYALWAGLVVIIAAGFLFAPVFHRIIHKFHWVEDHES